MALPHKNPLGKEKSFNENISVILLLTAIRKNSFFSLYYNKTTSSADAFNMSFNYTADDIVTFVIVFLKQSVFLIFSSYLIAR